jgi:hypothetical protein
VIAAKLILRGCENRSGSTATLPKSFGDDLAPEDRDNVMQILRQLQRLNMARRKPITGALELSHDAIVQIENIVLDGAANAPPRPVRTAPAASDTDAMTPARPAASDDVVRPLAAGLVTQTAPDRSGTADAPPARESGGIGSLLDSARNSIAAARRSAPAVQRPASAKPPAPAAEPGRAREGGSQSAISALAARAERARAKRDS